MSHVRPIARAVIAALVAATLVAAAPNGDAPAPAAKPVSLGKAKIGAYEVAVSLLGPVVPGKQVDVELKLSPDTRPTAIRGWIGLESARGSTRSKAHYHGDDVDLHLDVPEKLPQGAKLWVEIETDAGRAKGSFALP